MIKYRLPGGSGLEMTGHYSRACAKCPLVKSGSLWDKIEIEWSRTVYTIWSPFDPAAPNSEGWQVAISLGFGPVGQETGTHGVCPITFDVLCERILLIGCGLLSDV